VIKAFGGNDTLYAKDAADELRAGLGDDANVYGENGNDTYYGGGGDDFLSEYSGITPEPPTGQGYTGADVMFGGGGTDWLDGARSDDELHGGDNPPLSALVQRERFFGQTGDDKLYGEDGPDDLQGQQGSDLMSGGAGDDSIDAAATETANSPDTVRCGGGFDTVIANNNDSVSNGCETITREENPA
jgi:Ca2+-binding RTX toxin-like protein